MRRRFPARPEVKRNSDTRLAPPLARRQASDPAPQHPAPRQTRLQRFATGFRNHPVTVCIEALGYLGLIFAVCFFFIDLKDRQDERIARSWQLLTTPAPGNSGKREALAYLNSRSMCISVIDWCWKERTPLTGIDLSRNTHRGRVFLEEVDLSGADLSGAKLDGALLKRANFSGANLTDASINDADLERADLSKAKMVSASLEGSNFTGADLTEANLEEAKISGSYFTRADLRRANLEAVDAQNSIFNNASLFGVNAQIANFTESYFDTADMNEGDYSQANFTNAKLLNSGLGKSKLIDVNISGTDFNPNSESIGNYPFTWDSSVTGASGGSAGEDGGDIPIPTAKQFRTTFPQLDQEDSWNKAWAYVDNVPTGLPLPLMMKLRYERPRDRKWPEELAVKGVELMSIKNPVDPALLTYDRNTGLPNDVYRCEWWDDQCRNRE